MIHQYKANQIRPHISSHVFILLKIYTHAIEFFALADNLLRTWKIICKIIPGIYFLREPFNSKLQEIYIALHENRLLNSKRKEKLLLPIKFLTLIVLLYCQYLRKTALLKDSWSHVQHDVGYVLTYIYDMFDTILIIAANLKLVFCAL